MTLAEKIARLVAEKGWNQLEFARRTGLNRNTVRAVLTDPDKHLRNDTVRRCADALGVSVHDLHQLSLNELLKRSAPPIGQSAAKPGGSLLLALAAQPELKTWLEANPERAKTLSADELDELLSLHGVGGPLTQEGVEHFVGQLERRRELLRRVTAIAGTDYGEVLEKVVELMWEKIQV